MKIGVLGSGTVAQTPAAGLEKHGYEIKMGSRSPEKLAEWASQNPKVSTGTFADAAIFGELLILTVKGNAAAEALRLAGAEAARAIEPLCMLWCIPGFLHNQWTHAFKLLIQ